MDRNHVLTPRSSRWAEFLGELGKAPLCHRTTEHARRVLNVLPGVDTEATLEALAVLGGRCDCAILFDLGDPEDHTGTDGPDSRIRVERQPA